MARLGPVAAAIAEEVRAAGRDVPADLGFAQARLPLADGEALTLALATMSTTQKAVEAVRRRGRPRGSRNRRSEDLARWLLRRYAHPLEVLMQMASRPTSTLAAELGCKPAEALAVQKSAAAEALPYFESKKPVAVQVDGRVIQLRIVESVAVDRPGEDGQEAIDGEKLALRIVQQAVAESVENQLLADDAPGELDR